MNKWYDEEYEFEVEVTGYLRGDSPVRYCRNGEEIGDKYTCTYGCPVNKDGFGICSKTMMMLYPADGGGAQRRRSYKSRRQRQICKRYCLPRRLRYLPPYSQAARQP